METLLWIVALIVVGGGMFVLGTRSGPPAVGDCAVNVHWYFGWWVRCKGGKSCPGGHCKLEWKPKQKKEWSDAGVIPGGSVKWSDDMDYRCVCG